MTKKIIGLAFSGIITATFICCGVKDKIEKHNKAKSNADYIMQSLGREDLTDQFPEKYFPRTQLKPFMNNLTKKCDFNSKRGKFVDFFTMNNKGKNLTAFIYEYIFSSDSLRFIYIYDLDTSEPELYHLEIEGLEQRNRMIIDPSKQLLYQEK
jgi:hypothetical protein